MMGRIGSQTDQAAYRNETTGNFSGLTGPNANGPEFQLGSEVAGERNPGTSNDYLVSVEETNATVVDVATDETDVSSTVPALLFGVYVNTVLSAQVLPLKDGTGGTTIVTIPASAAAGSMYHFPGLKFNVALIVDPDNAATGNITVAWRPQG